MEIGRSNAPLISEFFSESSYRVRRILFYFAYPELVGGNKKTIIRNALGDPQPVAQRKLRSFWPQSPIGLNLFLPLRMAYGLTSLKPFLVK